MNRRVLLRSFFIALSGACGGCATPVAEITPSGSVTVRIDPEITPTRATIGLANEVTVVLPPPSPSDHRWEIAQHNTLTLGQQSDLAPQPNGEWTIHFLARRRGVTRVLFVLVPPTHTREYEPADVREMQLRID